MIDNSMEFSVSLAVHGKDNPDFFREAVESILWQTAKPSEIVLVVDGPVPGQISEIVQGFSSRCDILRVVRLEKSLGHGNARRKGLEGCTKDLVALMDSDDISLPHRFEKQLEVFARDRSVSVVGGNIAEFIGSTDHIVGIRKVPSSDEDIRRYLRSRCPLNQVTVMFRKQDVQAAGGYMDWFQEEDYYLWIRMYEKGFRFRNLDDTLVLVRVGPDMYRRRGGLRYFLSEARLQRYMLERHIIGVARYFWNFTVRLVVQVLIPNSIRGLVFQRFFRN